MQYLPAKSAVLAAVAATLLALPAAQATVVVDQSPTGPRVGSWSNNSTGQNFLVQFTLADATSITGFDIFTGKPYASLGTSVTVKIRNDVAGGPAAVNLFEFVDTIDSKTSYDADADMSSVDFSPVALGPGTYWMGVSGTATELSWLSYNNGGAAFKPYQKQLSGNGAINNTSFFDLGYRIRADAAAMPEPATLALVGLALAGLRVMRRQRA